MTPRREFENLDAQDPLASLRDLFELPEGIIYLDGNSLGPMPRAAAARMQQVMREEWGQGLIQSWNEAGWIDLPRRVGDKIARLVGVGSGEVMVADSTSVNLFKVLSAALRIMQHDRPDRRVILSERTNFPTDLYIAESLAQSQGFRLELAEAGEIPSRLRDDVALLLLTQVNYRTGHLHDMANLNGLAHHAGALAIWDLAHSAGALPVNLMGDGSAESAADFAVGCGYKFLNGGPGAPAFVWAHPRNVGRFRQPLSGWLGHAAPFDFTPGYEPAHGIGRYLCGTPPVLSMVALECGVDTLLTAESLGGLAALRDKSIVLTDAFIKLVEERCAGFGLGLVTPKQADQRGSQVSFTHPTGGYPIIQALIARGVIGDFRAPDILRFGFTPIYTRYSDVWDAVEQLRAVLESGEWSEARFKAQGLVT
ncbi:MAG: kynureninase [Holophagaceae bacterium]|nr:kynureninase [Holophagaceae bacterium]